MDKKIEKYFKAFPKADAIYTTSDGQAFVDRLKADSHAHILKDKKVTAHLRNEATPATGAPKDTVPAGDEKEAAKAQLLELDLTADTKDVNYDVLEKLVKTLGVETVDNKKVTFIEALAKLQTELKSAE